MKKIIDLNMHIIPGVDDGSDSFESSEKMFRTAIEQGAEVVFSTSQSFAYHKNTWPTKIQYRKLQKLIRDEKLSIKVVQGCEIKLDDFNIDELLVCLKTRIIPSLNGKRYILVEVTKDFTCLNKLLDEGWIPVISHAELNDGLDIEDFVKLKEKGCLLQVNIQSILEGNRVLDLLNHSLVDFVGSDNQCFDYQQAAKFLYENYKEEYVDAILYDNAKEILLKELEETSLQEETIWLNGLAGTVIGNALGFPILAMKREEKKQAPIYTMDEFGTWGDEAWLSLVTMESILEKNMLDYNDIMNRFVQCSGGEYPTDGYVVSQDKAFEDAIFEYEYFGKDYLLCAKDGEDSSQSGVLGRILPVLLYSYEEYKNQGLFLEDVMEQIHKSAALTHIHPLVKIAAEIYYFLVEAILDEEGTLLQRLQKGIDRVKLRNQETWSDFERLSDLMEFSKVPEEKMKGGAYIVEGLEAAIWSIITTESFEEALLKAVNLGEANSRVGAIAGGLAGLYYGYNKIPLEWKAYIANKDKLVEVCMNMSNKGKSL